MTSERTAISASSTGLEDPALEGLLEDANQAGALDGVRLGQLLRHLPARRATFAAHLEDLPVVVKVFGSPRARGNDRRLRALGAGLPDLVPRSIRVDPRGHVGILSFAAGRVLDTVDDETFVEAAGRVGRALARLHCSAAPLDREWTWHDETTQLLKRMPSFSMELAREAVAAPVVATALVPSHRDFHPRQVVVDGGGKVHLIDLDDAAMAPPGLDLGNMVAHLRREAVLGRHAPHVVDRAVEELLAGYGDPPPDLTSWERLALVRLVGLAEWRHHDLVQRDALAALVPAPSRRGTWGSGAPPGALPTGHADRPVRVDRRADGSEVVVKCYLGADGAAVHESMQALWRSDFGGGAGRPPRMPEPLGYAVAPRELTMSLVPGEPLSVRGVLGRSLEHAAGAAALLAALHGSGVVVPRTRAVPRLLRSASHKVHDRLGSPARGAFLDALAALEAYAARVPADPALVPTHGDFSPRNVLVEGEHLALIDFDRVQMAPPARDVAYWTAWLWATATLGSAPHDDPWALGDGFVAAYLAQVPDAPVGGSVLALHRGLALLRIAHGWSALRRDETSLRTILAEVQALVEV